MGPTLPISQEIHAMKYRLANETFEESCDRIARTLADDDLHRERFKRALLDMRFLPAGRIQASVGAPRNTTAFNCYVSGPIEDSMESIMQRATEAAMTMRMGGGIGYDFSHLRPRGDLIKTLDSHASGPVSFMGIYDAICHTIASAGHRRGAQMGILRVDHPDIEEFINAKRNDHHLTGFNISVAITDAFMNAVLTDDEFPLTFEGRVYRTVRARYLWDQIMRSTWDWAEPGVIFIDRINEMNNLWYCETIHATNPCGEQPLPPYGACLLGSFNLTRYVKSRVEFDISRGDLPYKEFSWYQFEQDIKEVVRAMDNVIDNTIYPLPEQEREAKSKRRMGLGITGLANAAEALGYPYASNDFISFMKEVLTILRDGCYDASVKLAREKGPFPLFDKELYCEGKFFRTLPESLQNEIYRYGIRNSHLLSIAPTGTISLSADNVSSGIEPPFSLYYDRTIQTFEGPVVERVSDYAFHKWGIRGKTANEISVEDHVRVLTTASYFIDSAISKTCNVGDHVTWEEFKNVYLQAWRDGAKGVTTFRAAGKRYGVLQEIEEEPVQACFIDPTTGQRSCG